MGIGDEIVSSIVDELQREGVLGITIAQINQIVATILTTLKVTLAAKEVSNLVHKHFEAAGYRVRVGSSRPQYEGRKQSAVIREGSKPSDIVTITNAALNKIARKVARDLK